MRISTYADAYLPPSIRPYLFLSHPVSTAPEPLSIYWARYYTSGPDDIYLFIGWSVIIVLARFVILKLFKWLALWYLGLRDRRKRAKALLALNGHANGNGNGVAKKDATAANGIMGATGVATAIATPNGHTNGDAHTNGNGSSTLRSRTVSNGSLNEKAGTQSPSLTRRLKMEATLAKRHRTATRFAEQGFSLVYYMFAWIFGVWVNTSMYPDGLGPLNTDAYWTYFPHTPLPGPIKAYYFLAFAFYATQVVILNIEEHRSDHWQMFTHHVVTVGLIAYSYGTHLTRPGCAILVLLDFCDIFLPAAKMVKYMRIPVLPDVFFVIFLVSWFITRQVLLLKIILSVTLDMPYKLDLTWKPEEQRYVTYGSYLFFTISLWILYALLCVWFGLGCKVAWNVVRGQGASEVRSDDEDEESDEVSTPALSRTQSKED